MERNAKIKLHKCVLLAAMSWGGEGGGGGEANFQGSALITSSFLSGGQIVICLSIWCVKGHMAHILVVPLGILPAGSSLGTHIFSPWSPSNPNGGCYSSYRTLSDASFVPLPIRFN